MTQSNIVTISPKYQVVIPRAIRDSMGLQPGQKVQAVQYRDRIEFIPVRPMRAMRGFVRGIESAGRAGPGERGSEGRRP